MLVLHAMITFIYLKIHVRHVIINVQHVSIQQIIVFYAQRQQIQVGLLLLIVIVLQQVIMILLILPNVRCVLISVLLALDSQIIVILVQYQFHLEFQYPIVNVQL